MTNEIAMNASASECPERSRFLRRYEQLFFLTSIAACALPGFAPLRLVMILSLWVYLVLSDSVSMAGVMWFISVTLNLLVGFQVGAVFHLVPQNFAISHTLRLLLFFISVGIGGYTATQCHISRQRLDRLIFVIAVGMMLLKLVFVFGIFAGIPLEQMQSLFGFSTPTSGLGFGLQRLQFPSDIVAPFLIACYVGGEKKWKDSILLICLAGVVLLSFSRYLFAFYIICTILRAFWVKRLDFITLLNILVCLTCLAIFFETLLSRFASADTKASDEVRVDQIHYLMINIRSFPLFGTGLGSEAHDYLRSEDTPYFYEAQWYATTMQMGFIGMFWYLANILLAAYVPLRRNYIPFTIVFMMWLFSGFTNPYLTALGSAFGIAILMLRCNGTPPLPSSATIA